MEPERRKTHPDQPVSDEEATQLDNLIQRAVKQVVVPPSVPPPPEELERRKRVFAEIEQIRDQIGPIGTSTAELIRQDRGWPEEASG